MAIIFCTDLRPALEAESFSEQLNPTGDPIGGGPGYRDIMTAGKSRFVVATSQELVAAIGEAGAGDTIYVRDDAVIDMTGSDDQAIPGGVTLASGRGRKGSLGALIFSNTLSEGNKFMPLFRTGGKDVRITGLRMRGPVAEVGDADYSLVKIANGIKSDHEDLQVDNCELWAWNKWSIDLAVAGGANIHHNYIHHTRRWGYGYGVWVRGGGKALIEANLFDFCRHHIGSGSQATSSYEARYNICLDHDVQPSFDRHGSQKKAGYDTLIHHNEFRNPAYPAILLRGNPLGEARFHHNWFAHANQKAGIDDRRGKQREKIHIHDNVYGYASSRFHPKAVATAAPAVGAAPLTVQFDGSESQDREGGKVAAYRWNFPDTPSATGVSAYTVKPSYRFNEPGRYLVELYASNEYGVPGLTRIPVTVHPPKGGYILSAWVKDSYVGPLNGYLRKQVLIDGEVIWEDDLEGDEGGWQHLMLDVEKWVKGKTEIELTFRLTADKAITEPRKQIFECYYYVDDVHLFGGEVKNGDFELGRRWTYLQAQDEFVPTGPMGENEAAADPGKVWLYEQKPGREKGGFRIFIPRFWTGEARSGQWVHVIGSGINQKIAAGSVCEVKQKVRIGPKPGPWK